MLVLTRTPGEGVVINSNITITVLKVDGKKVRLGIEAPDEIPIRRQEIELAMREQLEPEPAVIP